MNTEANATKQQTSGGRVPRLVRLVETWRHRSRKLFMCAEKEQLETRWNGLLGKFLCRTSKSIRPLALRLDHTLNLLTKMETKQHTDSGSDDSTCSPSSLTPETAAEEWTSCDGQGDICGMAVDSNFARKLERERDELAGYLCRIKLPLPVRFVADLAKLFPGKNIRMKNADGYLCIFSENAIGHAPGEKGTANE